MYTTSILLSSIEAVKQFVKLTNRYNFPITLCNDQYNIDAKSIMGIFSLDLSKPLKLEVESENADDFIEQIQPFKSKIVPSGV